ncbi:hypothetical protein BLX87_23020 [Bacillus sp. VT-16-64]|nr:hypothetical protein BLX87_23020 [Bacillus sp. VT-16-64]
MVEEKSIQTSGFVIQPRLKFQSTKDKMMYQFLLDEANYIPSERCQIGQTIIVMSDLSKELGWSRDVIRGCLNRLEESKYITVKTLPQKRGMLITVSHYKDFQSLATYEKRNKKESKNPQENPHEESQENPHESKAPNRCGSKEEDMSKNSNPHEEPQENPHEIPHTITAFINNIYNINKTLKEYIAEAPVKNKNLSSTEDAEIFVDFASRTNAIPVGVNHKLLVSYFDCIRHTRQTCTISANILVNFIEKLQKYSANQINYAIWNHVEKHDDKKEQYTLGILRHTNEHEARRGLIKLKNKGGELGNAVSGDDSQYDYGF